MNVGPDQTVDVLSTVPGGPALLEFMGGGLPNFGDAEIISLKLDRVGNSVLRLRTNAPSRNAEVSFEFADTIDVSIKGFSHQNVISGLALRWASQDQVDTHNVGVGLRSGDIDIELKPCFGAFGTIRATIRRITIAPPL